MKEDLRKNIAFAQTVVSLGRDLILIVIVIFAALIVYFGGDPKKLSEFDWALLVGAAMLVILGPALMFYFAGLIQRIIEKGSQYYLYGVTKKVPRGIHLLWYIRIRKLSLKTYVKKWKKKRFKKEEVLFYQFRRMMISLHFKLNRWFFKGVQFIYPVVVLLIGAVVFYEVLSQYIKP